MLVLPGQETVIHMGSLPVSLLVRPSQHGGPYLLAKQVLPPGALIAPHRHARQDQVNIVIDGSLGFLEGDREFAAPPGSTVVRRAGVTHALWNPGTAAATMIEITSPGAEMEQFFLGFDALTAAAGGQPDAAAAAELAARFGITYDLGQIPRLEIEYGVQAGGAQWVQ
jgi:mannose-6-phosphate isomerase-like protein (cupin superfamily)